MSAVALRAKAGILAHACARPRGRPSSHQQLAGAEPVAEINGTQTEPLEGRSLAPVLRGEERPEPSALYWEWAGNCAIRRDRWKLVWDTLNEAQQWELYDVEADRTELYDLATEKPGVVKELRAAYEQWATSTGRRIPKTTAL